MWICLTKWLQKQTLWSTEGISGLIEVGALGRNSPFDCHFQKTALGGVRTHETIMYADMKGCH